MKYNLSHKKKDLIKTLAMEPETAVGKLPIADQDYVRCLVAKNIELLYKQNNSNRNHTTPKAYTEMRVIRNIRTKLLSNNAIVLKADKGNTIVICYANDYYRKTEDFIHNNQFSITNNDPTNTFQKKYGRS